MGKGVWGIDVSKSSIKVARIEGLKTSLSLTHVGILPYEGIPGEEGRDLDAQVRETLARAKTQYGIGGEPVILSLPSHSTFNRLIKLPPVDDAKLPEIVRYEAQSQIPFPIDEVLWDYQYVHRTYAPGEEKEVILFAIKRDGVEQFLANIAPLGFNIEAVQFGPVALFNFLLKDQEVGAAAVALDMGGDNTDLIVIDGTKFWVRNLPLTGGDITKALQKAFDIPFEEAEKLKLKAPQSQQAQKIFNAIQPVLRDLVNEINRSIGYYKSISKTSRFDKIILLGNATHTLNFQRFVSQSLQLPVARVQKLNTLQTSSLDPGELEAALPTIGTALGLALQGITDTVNRINLLPPSYLRKKEVRKKRPYVLAAAAALYALVGVAWFRQTGEIDLLRATQEGAKGAQLNATGQNDRFNEARQVEDVLAHLDPLANTSWERDLVLKVMDQINPNIPENGNFEMNPQGKLWVVDWKFEEKDASPATAVAPGSGGFNPKQGTLRPMPAKKRVTATLEVVIAKRANVQDGRNHILRTLLNYSPQNGKPVNTSKPCAIVNSHWNLAEGEGPAGSWRVEQDAGELVMPVPRDFYAVTGQTPPEGETPYWRYLVTLQIPVGPENRTPAKKSAEAAGK